MRERQRSKRFTLGADKGYDRQDFVEQLRMLMCFHSRLNTLKVNGLGLGRVEERFGHSIIAAAQAVALKA